MKYVQGGIIQRKMSTGDSVGRNFQKGKLFREGEVICLGVVVFGGNYSGVFVLGERGVIILGEIS